MAAFRAEATKGPYRNNNRRFTLAVAHCQHLAQPILEKANAFLSSDQYDAKLIKASVIAEATPRRLAAFSQKSRANEMLIHSLLTNPALMRQMQMADGARHGNYGLSMAIYTAIERASVEARKGILQRLALATALNQRPHIRFRNEPAYNPLTRYLDYQQAYVKGQLDPACAMESVLSQEDVYCLSRTRRNGHWESTGSAGIPIGRSCGIGDFSIPASTLVSAQGNNPWAGRCTPSDHPAACGRGSAQSTGLDNIAAR